MRYPLALALLYLAATLPHTALADPPEIRAAMATRTGDTWRIDVTIAHPDTGWDHYADGWEVIAPTGEGIGFRELLHPHVNEQPFTRSLQVSVPEGVGSLFIRARCLQDGWGETKVPLALE
ncbi:hypothetical protein SAMN05421688_1265 [Poseidonocella pacifica]|uniref:Uncharacterized protein n=1 Tax=Poseidonocella pacifica TaxID=871651 RepID=A0A1I0WD13_9RHOB|nr:hypothetical protein [Poseidonocella pacifica]SFA86287.1 hypothetical protein SAMN05421688_1265 [Poseidonocella pacifica]